MFKKASLQVAALAVLLFGLSQVSGIPVSENKDGIEATATGDARIKPSNWLHFNHSRPFHSRPSVTDNKEDRVGDLRKKLDALEKIQNTINGILKKITGVVSKLTAYCAAKGYGKPTVSPIPDFTDFTADDDGGKPMDPTLSSIPDFASFFADNRDEKPMDPTLSSIPDFASFFADNRDEKRVVPDLSPISDFADARTKPSHSLNFNHTWPFPSLPSVTDLLGGAHNKEGPEEELKKRVDALDKMQKSINEIVMKLNRDLSALTACCLDAGPRDPLIRALSPISDFANTRIKPFNHTWSFPLLTSVSGVFHGADNKEGWVDDLQKRVDALVEIQKTIYETLKSLAHSVSIVAASCADKDKPSVPPVSVKPDITPSTDKDDKKPMVPTLYPIPDFTVTDNESEIVPILSPTTMFPRPSLPPGIFPIKPGTSEEP